MNNNRVPAGTPEGGQFANNDHRENDGLSLSGSHSFDGSFRYPPPLETAEETIQFWEHCPVEDKVIDKLRRDCANEVGRRRDGYVRGWVQDNPAPQNPNDRIAWNMAYQKVVAQSYDLYQMPNRGDLRTLARLNQMTKTAISTLSKDQQDILARHEFSLPISRQRGTAEGLLEHYGAADAELDDVEANNADQELLSIMKNINANLDNIVYRAVQEDLPRT